MAADTCAGWIPADRFKFSPPTSATSQVSILKGLVSLSRNTIAQLRPPVKQISTRAGLQMPFALTRPTSFLRGSRSRLVPSRARRQARCAFAMDTQHNLLEAKLAGRICLKTAVCLRSLEGNAKLPVNGIAGSFNATTLLSDRPDMHAQWRLLRLLSRWRLAVY